MASIPPTGGPSQPTPPEEPKTVLAKNLADATGKFTKRIQGILDSSHLADDPTTLQKVADAVKNLYQLSQEAGG